MELDWLFPKETHWIHREVCTRLEPPGGSKAQPSQKDPEEESRDNSVGIATGYGLDDRGTGVRVAVDARIFSSPRRPDRFWGPPIILSNGYWGLFPRRVKRPGREADHSPATSAEVKKM
jgi:hypothetical protein